MRRSDAPVARPIVPRSWMAIALPVACFWMPASLAQQGGVPRVHDPSVIRRGDTYTLFSTGRGVPIKKSGDLIRWEDAGRVFPEAEGMPEWAAREIPGAQTLWAPDISLFAGEYHLYYSVSTFGSQRSCIGLATNKTLDAASKDYRWLDRGKVIDSRPGRDDFNAIDPNVALDDQGTPWLAFGSFWGGIKMVRLDPRTGLRAAEGGDIRPLASRPPPDAIEAPFIVRKGDFYYLFVSFDYCCRGAKSDYNIVVGRSKEIAGPYADRDGKPMTEGGGTPVLAGYGRVRGPGHNAVLLRAEGDILVHHYYDADEAGAVKLQVRSLRWAKDGWPIAGEPLGK